MDNQTEVLVNSRLVTAEEWRLWRERGLVVREIAEMLGVSVGRAKQVSRFFRSAGVSDPLYHKRKSGPPGGLDTATDAGASVPGSVYAVCPMREQCVKGKGVRMMRVMVDETQIKQRLSKALLYFAHNLEAIVRIREMIWHPRFLGPQSA